MKKVRTAICLVVFCAVRPGIAQAKLSADSPGRLVAYNEWSAAVTNQPSIWAQRTEAAKRWESIMSLRPCIARPTAKGFQPLLGKDFSFMMVPLLAGDTAFRSSPLAAGDWFARYVPQEGVLLLRNGEKLSAWMKGLLFLTEGYRAEVCQYPLEGEDDFFALDLAVMGQCYHLLSVSGGKSYLELLTALRGEIMAANLDYPERLSAKQDAQLDKIFGKPVSPEERKLRQKLVLLHAHTWALKSKFGHEEAYGMNVKVLRSILSN